MVAYCVDLQQVPQVARAIHRVKLVQRRKPRGQHGGDGARDVERINTAARAAIADGWPEVYFPAACEKPRCILMISDRKRRRVATSSMSSSISERITDGLPGSGMIWTHAHMMPSSSSA